MASPALAALCWTLVSGGPLCSAPEPADIVQKTKYQFAQEHLDHAKATQVVIVYDNSPQWKTVKQQHPNVK